MARTHCTDEQYCRVRVTTVLEGFNMFHQYRGPYSTLGAARRQLSRELRMNHNASPTLSGIEVTKPITWEELE